ncbi:MAG: sulfurtransferase [Halobacteriales archaeon]
MTGDAPVVAPVEWLADRLDDPGLGVVDVRDGWEYDSIGHVPGAVSIPFDTFREADGGDVGMLPGAERFASLLSAAGIERGDTLVAYDDEHGVFAARFLVTAIMYGHDDVRLLDGDYTAWSRQEATTTDAPDPDPTDYAVSIPDDRPLIDADGVLDVLSGEAEAVLIDTRTPEEFAEGHIEGAVNFDWRDLVDPDSRGLKSREELDAILDDHGVTPGKRVVLYCNTARRISHTYLVLKHLGYDRVDFFEGSLTQWRERDLPLVSGSSG